MTGEGFLEILGAGGGEAADRGPTKKTFNSLINRDDANQYKAQNSKFKTQNHNSKLKTDLFRGGCSNKRFDFFFQLGDGGVEGAAVGEDDQVEIGA